MTYRSVKNEQKRAAQTNTSDRSILKEKSLHLCLWKIWKY